MIDLGFRAGLEGFFDRAKVLKAIGKARTKVFNEFGRRVRSTALASIVYSEFASRPGKPPHAHRSRRFTRTSRSTGRTRTRTVSFLKEYLYYKYDFTKKSVVIGPERLAITLDSNALPALEYGGSAIIKSGGRKKRVRIAARPFMRPAFEIEKPGLSQLWRDSVH